MMISARKFFSNLSIRSYIHENHIAPKLDAAVDEAMQEIKNKIYAVKRETIIIVILNVLFVLFAYLLISKSTVMKLMISSVFLITLMYTLYTIINNWRLIYEYLFVYKLNIQKFIFQQIHKEVQPKVREEMDKLAWPEEVINDYKGISEPEITLVVTQRTTHLLLKSMRQMFGLFGFLFIFYHFYLKGLLVEVYTGMGFYEVLFYPFTLI